METKKMFLKDILSNNYLFSVPNYQRPYSWNFDHVETLLDDLKVGAFANGREMADVPEYFLGSVVLIKRPDDPEALVVDGQQRLVTLTIILAILRDNMGEQGRKLQRFIYQAEDELAGEAAEYRIRIRDRDQSVFSEYIQVDGKTTIKLSESIPEKYSDTQKRIINNAKICAEAINGMSEEERARISQFILQKCVVVVISSPDFDSAYKIFNVLNDRGMQLSPTDILKAKLLEKLDGNDEDIYAKKWEDSEDVLGRDRFRDLFYHIVMIYNKDKLRESLIKAFERHVLPAISAENAKNFINDRLEPYVEVFNTIVRSNHSSTGVGAQDSVNETLRFLNIIDNSDWTPCGLLYFSKFQDDDEKLLKFLQRLERLATTLMILRYNVNKRIKRYAEVLQKEDDFDSLLSNDSPLNLSNEEKVELIKCLESDIYLMHPAVRSYIMKKLNSAITDNTVDYTSQTVTIEHVLPQKPHDDSDWIKQFGWTEELRSQYVHKIGNLVLLSRRKNSEAGNLSFEEKKEKYFKSRITGVTTYALTVKVIGEKEWTPEIVQRRCKEYVDKLKQVWELSTPSEASD